MSLKSTNAFVTALLESGALQNKVVSIGGKAIYMETPFIRQCVTELLKLEIRKHLDPDATLSPLEMLAIHVLSESLHVPIPEGTKA